MKNTKKLLGQRIRELRKAKNLTQEQLAERAGIEIPSLSNIENGKNYPSCETIEKISKSLEVEIFELYIFEHLYEADNEELLKELNNILKSNPTIIKTLYNIALSLKNLY